MKPSLDPQQQLKKQQLISTNWEKLQKHKGYFGEKLEDYQKLVVIDGELYKIACDQCFKQTEKMTEELLPYEEWKKVAPPHQHLEETGSGTVNKDIFQYWHTCQKCNFELACYVTTRNGINFMSRWRFFGYVEELRRGLFKVRDRYTLS